jgi:hypothetical protein
MRARAALYAGRLTMGRRGPAAAWRARWGRPAVAVALGPASARLKRLSGLPAVADDGLLASVVREGVERFFIGRGAPLVTGGVRRVVAAGPDVTRDPRSNGASREAASADGVGDDDGVTAWAAAYACPAVADVVHACAAAGVVCAGFVPTALHWVGPASDRACAGATGRSSSTPRSPETGRRVALSACGTGWHVARVPRARQKRTRRAGVHGVCARGRPGVGPRAGGLGPEGWRCAAALGAALGTARLPGAEPEALLLDPRAIGRILAARASRTAVAPRRVPLWRLAVAGGACVAGVGSALARPVWRDPRGAPRRDGAPRPRPRARARGGRGGGPRRRDPPRWRRSRAYDRDRRSPTRAARGDQPGPPCRRGAGRGTPRQHGGSVVALAPRAGAVLTALAGIPDRRRGGTHRPPLRAKRSAPNRVRRLHLPSGCLRRPPAPAAGTFAGVPMSNVVAGRSGAPPDIVAAAAFDRRPLDRLTVRFRLAPLPPSVPNHVHVPRVQPFRNVRRPTGGSMTPDRAHPPVPASGRSAGGPRDHTFGA